MNCAMPRAPAGLKAAGRKLLSCQINPDRKATGRCWARAEESTIWQTEATNASPSSAASAGEAHSKAGTNAARDDHFLTRSDARARNAVTGGVTLGAQKLPKRKRGRPGRQSEPGQGRGGVTREKPARRRAAPSDRSAPDRLAGAEGPA